MKLLAATVVALAFPATAWGEATIVTRDLPVGGARSLAASGPTTHFNLVGLHWRGPGRVFFRTRGQSRWSGWHEADAEPEDLPDRGTDEARRMRNWRIGNPWWTGEAERIQVRTRGRIDRVRAHFVWSPQEPTLRRSLQMAGSPKIIPRSAWRANERIRRDNPDYARTLVDAIVHHTAGAGPRTPAQSAAIVRGIQIYHVLGNGWDDIGYNFLVDRFGQVFEGRYGGVERNVIGAHAQGFNTGSTGIAVIGSYGGAAPSAAARNALSRLIAWRLDVAHVYPIARTQSISSGNPRFRKGLPVWLRAVSGHRDTGFTSCPGAGLYGQLAAIARRAAAIGLPKLYSPRIEGKLGGLVSFTAQISASLPWNVTVFDAARQPVAVGTGHGRLVQWTWDARFVALGTYTYRISAGPNARPVTGTLSSAAGTATLEAVRADPAGVTPNGDGITDTTRLSYRLGAPASVTIELKTEDGALLALLFAGSKPAGPQVLIWDAAPYADGRYVIVVTARGRQGGRPLTASVPVVVSRTLSGYAVTPTAISPNGDGKNDAAAISFNLAVPAVGRLDILRGTTPLASLLVADLPAGPQFLAWDGRARDGVYRLALTVTDLVGPVTQEYKVRVDRVAPVLKRVSTRPLRVSLSEAAVVTFMADGVAVPVRRPKAGVFTVVLDRPFTRLDAFAEDDAGNASPRLTLR